MSADLRQQQDAIARAAEGPRKAAIRKGTERLLELELRQRFADVRAHLAAHQAKQEPHRGSKR